MHVFNLIQAFFIKMYYRVHLFGVYNILEKQKFFKNQ